MTRRKKRLGNMTDGETAMYRFIRGYIGQHGYAPSIRELKSTLGISSTSVVHYRLGQLEARGLVRRTPGVARGMWLEGKAAI